MEMVYTKREEQIQEEFKHNMKDSHLITREQKKEQKIKTTSNNKMVIRTYI